MKFVQSGIIAAALSLFVISCGDAGNQAEDAGDKMEEVANDAGEAMEDAADATGEAMEDAAETVDSMATEAGEKVEEMTDGHEGHEH